MFSESERRNTPLSEAAVWSLPLWGRGGLHPCLTLPEEEQRFVGVWGQRHLRYLKEYRRGIYLNLLTSGGLNDYLADIEEQAQERFERIVEQMKLTRGITEQLKAENQMEWVARMNNIQACAREIVDREIVYS